MRFKPPVRRGLFLSKQGSAERDLIRSGDGRVDVGDPDPVDPGQGAVLRIQRDVRQRMTRPDRRI